AMDNFRGVGRFQNAYDLDCEIQQLVTPHWLPGDPVPKSHAPQQLHRHKSAAVDLVDLVNCADIGVIEGGGCPRFAFEAMQCDWVARVLSREELKRHFAAELHVLGAVNYTHST